MILPTLLSMLGRLTAPGTGITVGGCFRQRVVQNYSVANDNYLKSIFEDKYK